MYFISVIIPKYMTYNNENILLFESCMHKTNNVYDLKKIVFQYDFSLCTISILDSISEQIYIVKTAEQFYDLWNFLVLTSIQPIVAAEHIVSIN
jgi:hypothetical protein